MESTETIGMTFVLGILGIGASFAIFILKRITEIPSKEELSFIREQIADIKKSLADLCERVGKEETKNEIYHTNHDLEDK